MRLVRYWGETGNLPLFCFVVDICVCLFVCSYNYIYTSIKVQFKVISSVQKGLQFAGYSNRSFLLFLQSKLQMHIIIDYSIFRLSNCSLSQKFGNAGSYRDCFLFCFVLLFFLPKRKLISKWTLSRELGKTTPSSLLLVRLFRNLSLAWDLPMRILNRDEVNDTWSREHNPVTEASLSHDGDSNVKYLHI